MSSLKNISAAIAFSLCVLPAFTASAADTESTPTVNAEQRDFAAGKKAVEAKDWNRAIDFFSKVVAQNNKSADGYTMLAYSQRWAGKLDDAFANYDKALALDPKHRGANNYLGIAYLKTNNLPSAQTQLAKLEGICGKSCDEYQSLAKAIAEFQPK
jgi:Flp pilus assembly protein TadD